MTSEAAVRPRSAATAHAVEFVAAHKPAAEAMGAALADDIHDPDAFAGELQKAFAALADPAYLAGQQFVAPGIGTTHGVRWPLIAAVVRGFKGATRGDRPTPLLFLADRLFREAHLEARWFAFSLIERTLAAEPERTWQLMRRAAREAGDWITIDELAHSYGAGIAAETYRWAELEQLVYSPSRWERRLVASTIATMTHGDRRSGRGPEVVERALPLLEQLMGDAEPDVQKALAWAYRSLAQIDLETTTNVLRAQAELAANTDDGHRAWVIRDSLVKLDAADADVLREVLAGIRRRPGAPSTSAAASMAARFGGLPDPSHHPEPPLT